MPNNDDDDDDVYRPTDDSLQLTTKNTLKKNTAKGAINMLPR